MPNAPHNRSPRTQLARPSGRQDSNLRPLVPQTSPHFPMSAEFDLEWFCRELVGMTTRACLMESVGIASTCIGIYWPEPIARLPRRSLDCEHSARHGNRRRRQLLARRGSCPPRWAEQITLCFSTTNWCVESSAPMRRSPLGWRSKVEGRQGLVHRIASKAQPVGAENAVPSFTRRTRSRGGRPPSRS